MVGHFDDRADVIDGSRYCGDEHSGHDASANWIPVKQYYEIARRGQIESDFTWAFRGILYQIVYQNSARLTRSLCSHSFAKSPLCVNSVSSSRLADGQIRCRAAANVVLGR